MKLQNKKTGEIREIKEILIDGMFNVKSLAELNEEWEDYEELKEYWFINDLDGKPMKCELRYCPVRDFTDWIEKRKQIGNYFETEEEAEKAVEKLKAWKRLKDKGFEFEWVDKDIGSIKFAFFNREGKITKEMWQDIDLLFTAQEVENEPNN